MIRLLARTTQIALDVVALACALALAFLVRFDWSPPPEMLHKLLLSLPYVVLLQYGLLTVFGVPRFSWRFVGLRETTRILGAIALSTWVLLLARAAAITWQIEQFLLVPLGVIAADFGLAFLATVGLRVVRRLLAEKASTDRLRARNIEQTPTILIGAGQAGALVAKELASRPDLGLRAVGFIDDDLMKGGSVLHGIPVLGTTTDIARLVAQTGARQALITIADAPGTAIRRIARLCEEAGVSTKIIPGVYEIVGGHVNLSRIRDVTIEDLLRREPVVLDDASISATVRGRVVMVTGAGGSIGSELCRQVSRFEPAKLVLVEQAENSLFHIHRELVERFAEVPCAPCIADICDAGRMEQLFGEHKPSVVFHAAAHKHVPMMEWNPAEAVKNNVLGTRLIADLADAHGVSEFVMISTDKAVNPTSIMGVSKRTAEIYIQALSQTSATRFVTVRFGNVLGSAGSVIPLFQEQIAKGGPVTVTHPEMKRYFMTIPEACQLVIQSAALGKGGEIFILDMGEPVKIVDLARDLITLSGMRPDEDIEIRFSGMRPGEKLFEELSVADEMADKTRHPKIFVGKNRPCPLAQISSQVEELRLLAIAGDGAAVRRKLRVVVPEFVPPEERNDQAEVAAPAVATAG